MSSDYQTLDRFWVGGEYLGNQLVFETLESRPGHILVTDKSCSLSRSYQIGRHGPLSIDDECQDRREDMTMIESFEQVIEAWKTKKIWF